MGGLSVTRKASPSDERRRPRQRAALPAGGGTTTAVPPLSSSGVMPDLTLSDVARRLDVSPATLRRWVKDGIVPLRRRPLDARGGRPRAHRRAAARARVLARPAARGGRTRAGSPTATSRTCSRRRRARTRSPRRREETGLEPALIERIWTAAGLLGRRRWSGSARRTCSCCATWRRSSTPGFPLVAFLQLVRVYGQALAQIADAEVKLFHLFVHEPLMRDGVPGLEIAEEMEGLAAELLPLASPIMDRVHQRCAAALRRARTSSATSSSRARGDELGRLRVAIAFADLAGYTRLTEEAGEEEALDVVERFVEAVEDTLPDDARVIKTIGDEVMVVGADPSALVDWAVGFQALNAGRRPLPRIGIHCGERALPRRRLLRPRGQPRLARRRARGRRRGARDARRSSTAAGPHLAFEPIGEVELKGFSEATDLFLARAPEDESTSASRRRPARPGRRSSCSSRAAATRSACSTSRCGSRAPVTRAARQLRAARRRRTATRRSARDAVRAARRARWRSDRAGRARAATCRPGRATSATRRRAARLAAAPIATGHTATDQVETVLYRLAASPGRRALLGMRRARRAARPPAARRSRARRPRRTARERGLPWREDPTNAVADFARNRVRDGLLPALRALHPARRGEHRCARSALLRDEAEVLDDRRRRRARRPDRRRALARAAAGARAARACSGWPTAPRPARRGCADEILALGAGGRHAQRSTSAAACARSSSTGGCGSSDGPRRAAARRRSLPVPGSVAYGERAAHLRGGRRRRRSTPTALAPRALDVRAVARRATACARSASAAAARSRTSSPTARSRASAGARRARWSSAGGEIAWVPGRRHRRALPRPRRRTTRPGAPVALALDCAAMLQRRAIGEILVQADELQHRVRELGGRDLARLRGQGPAADRRAQGRRLLPGRPDAPHRRPVRGRLHGGRLLRLVDRLLGRRADPQGPRRPARGPRRPDRRGHRRLRADAAVPACARSRRAVRRRWRSARCSPSPSGARSRPPRATLASRSRTSSRSATGSTTRSATATCRTSRR